MKNKYTLSLKNSGQAVVESILMISMLLITFSVIVALMKKTRFIQNLIAKPWTKIDNVIKYGDVSNNPVHPNSISRQNSLDPR